MFTSDATFSCEISPYNQGFDVSWDAQACLHQEN